MSKASDEVLARHVGNNVFARHRNRCRACAKACIMRRLGQPAIGLCPQGAELLDEASFELEVALSEVA